MVLGPSTLVRFWGSSGLKYARKVKDPVLYLLTSTTKKVLWVLEAVYLVLETTTPVYLF